MKTYTTTPDDAGKRLDHFLVEQGSLSRSQLQKQIKAEQILLNNLPAKPHTFLKAGDTITIPTPKKEQKTKTQSLKEAPKLEILFENEDAIVVNKPAGLVVHKTNDMDNRITLADLLLKAYPKLKSVGESPLRPGIMHRLDKDVSGVLLVAKNQKAFKTFKAQFMDHSVEKIYIALCYGILPKTHDTISLKIARSKTQGRMVARPESQEGKEAITEYTVQKTLKTTTLAKVKILTGRTHQIRAHFKGIGHPLVGDTLYIRRYMKHIKPIPLNRIFLHATSLAFTDTTGERHTISAPLPQSLVQLVDNLPTL